MQGVNRLGLGQIFGTNKSAVLVEFSRSKHVLVGSECHSLKTAVPVIATAAVDSNVDTSFQPCHMFVMQTHSLIRRFSTTEMLLTPKVDPKKDYYGVLGVTPSCPPAKVKAAFYRLSKIHHPDINKSEEAVNKFHELSEAHEILTNSRLRQQYEEGRRIHVHRGVHRGVRTQHHGNYRARGPAQKANPTHYNYDEWIDKHYSSLFAESQKQREKNRKDGEEITKQAKASRKVHHELQFPFGFVVSYVSCIIAAGSLISMAMIFIHISKTE